jgi:alkanesulfonate monooxygenase SsuD/methylene tetrahydromethanopterin reductase-like flavin-dependent oxidoreductase (luciferase family)
VQFGIFMEFETREGESQPEAFRSAFELIDAAEAWGLDAVWLGEMHFTPTRSVLSEPIVVASAIAARTERLRLGVAVRVLPLSHPLRIAEETATLDQISEGRLDFGIGRSGSPRSYDALGVPYGESQARFREALGVIIEAWKGEPFSHHGEFFSFDKIAVSPRTYQQPHPPLRMAATSADTFPLVGELGLPIFVGLRGNDVPQLRSHLEAYRQAWREAGHPTGPHGDGDVLLRIPLYAAPTLEAAIEEPRQSTEYFLERQATISRASLGRAGGGPEDLRREEAERLESVSYDEVLATKVAFGTSDSLVDRLGELRDELGLSGVVAELNAGGLIPPDRVLRSLRLLTHEVMPTL